MREHIIKLKWNQSCWLYFYRNAPLPLSEKTKFEGDEYILILEEFVTMTESLQHSYSG
jgi:hypothetical protein